MNRRLRRLRGRLQRLRFVVPGWISYWLLHPHAAGVNREVVRETWDAVADGAHNSNTDLTFFDGWFYLCHQTSPYHLGSRRSRLLLWRSRDARTWSAKGPPEFPLPNHWMHSPPLLLFEQNGARLYYSAKEPDETVTLRSARCSKTDYVSH